MYYLLEKRGTNKMYYKSMNKAKHKKNTENYVGTGLN